MAISPYLKRLRERIGRDLVLMPGVAAVIRDRDGRVLVERRSDDPSKFSLPAGATDPGEAPAKALVREVWEETGLIVRPTEILGIFGGRAFRTVYPNGDEVEYTVTVFACAVRSGTLAPLDGEALELLYVEPARLPELGLPYPRSLFDEDSEAGTKGKANGSRRPGSTWFDWDEAWLDP